MRKPVDDPRRVRLGGKILPLYEKAKSRIRGGQIENEEIVNCYCSRETDSGVPRVEVIVRLSALAFVANGSDIPVALTSLSSDEFQVQHCRNLRRRRQLHVAFTGHEPIDALGINAGILGNPVVCQAAGHNRRFQLVGNGFLL